ncbi:hypothetical protein [Nocardia farcinica]|uniref:hypothetical protein n=1 Tax=Nocardia farcinica TaxID=37329 RepID=UPI001893402A|nr:hypothetical protein [Nocardia farcinica]MBF6293691.1 hypothetical protein [Nocardia farcinica]MBF6380547.1 hypothetical protein [Nocardia farcinica]
MWHEFAEQTFEANLYDPGLYGDDGDRRWTSADGAEAWLHQCLTQVSETGLVAVPMPVSAATSRQARTLRGVSLRKGVLRALVAGLDADRHLWVLSGTDGERPDHVLLIDAAGDPTRVATAWRAFRDHPTHPDAAGYAVRVIDRLDDRVDLTPADPGTTELDRYPDLLATLAESPLETAPALAPAEPAAGVVTLGELAEAGMVSFHQSPPTVRAETGVPMWTAKDVRLGRPPSRLGDEQAPGAVPVRPGDVVAVMADRIVRVFREGEGVLLGPGIELVRADPEVLDPEFLAGVLRAAVEGSRGSIDLYEVALPRLTPADQRRYARAFARLRKLEEDWLQRRATIEALVRIGYRGLATARLRPADTGDLGG